MNFVVCSFTLLVYLGGERISWLPILLRSLVFAALRSLKGLRILLRHLFVHIAESEALLDKLDIHEDDHTGDVVHHVFALLPSLCCLSDNRVRGLLGLARSVEGQGQLGNLLVGQELPNAI